MTEMHTPIRALFIVDAPIQRVEAVLARRKELHQLVRNEWVRFFVRDPETNRFYKQSDGNYLPMSDSETVKSYFPFKVTHHYNHALKVTHREAMIYWTEVSGMLLATGVQFTCYLYLC